MGYKFNEDNFEEIECNTNLFICNHCSSIHNNRMYMAKNYMSVPSEHYYLCGECYDKLCKENKPSWEESDTVGLTCKVNQLEDTNEGKFLLWECRNKELA